MRFLLTMAVASLLLFRPPAAWAVAPNDPVLVDLVRRIAKTVVLFEHGYHAEACIDLARTFDDTADFQKVTGASIEAGMTHTADQWVADPVREENYVKRMLSTGDVAGACYVRYSFALIYKSKTMDAEAERSLKSARGYLVQLAAPASAAPDPVASPQTTVVASDTAAIGALKLASKANGVRLALLIANDHYRSGIPPLNNPQRDVVLLAGSLRKAGFADVTVIHDADRSAMVAALRAFQDKADHADTALIYYAGHGIQSGGENYVIPVDARLADERALADEAVSQDRLLASMAKVAKLKILVLDACRDNPFAATMKTEGATRGIDRGLARVPPPRSHMVVVYSAAPGTRAEDGAGANSPFATALAHRIVQPGVEVDLMFRQVTDDVERTTNGKQSPNMVGNIGADPFYFVPVG